MRRVVVSGMGIVSSIGNSTQEVLASLREPRADSHREYKRLGFRCHVHGARRSFCRHGDRRALRFFGGVRLASRAMDQAIRDAGLEPAKSPKVKTAS